MKEKVIAHRGDHKKYFENTLNAFIEAGKNPFYGIETDIHLSKDKKWVIHHDPDFLSNGTKYVIKDIKAEELYKMPLDNEQGDKEAFIPSLEDYLKVCKQYKRKPIIEIKPSNPSFHDLRKMMKLVRKDFGFDFDGFTVIAFYPWPLIKLRLMYGYKIHLQHLIAFNVHPELINLAYKLRMDIDIEFKALTEELVKKFHAKNLKVNVWCVDNLEDLKTVQKWGVDHVTTNKFIQED